MSNPLKRRPVIGLAALLLIAAAAGAAWYAWPRLARSPLAPAIETAEGHTCSNSAVADALKSALARQLAAYSEPVLLPRLDETSPGGWQGVVLESAPSPLVMPAAQPPFTTATLVALALSDTTKTPGDAGDASYGCTSGATLSLAITPLRPEDYWRLSDAALNVPTGPCRLYDTSGGEDNACHAAESAIVKQAASNELAAEVGACSARVAPWSCSLDVGRYTLQPIRAATVSYPVSVSYTVRQTEQGQVLVDIDPVRFPPTENSERALMGGPGRDIAACAIVSPQSSNTTAVECPASIRAMLGV